MVPWLQIVMAGYSMSAMGLPVLLTEVKTGFSCQSTYAYFKITHNFKSRANSNNPLRGSVLKWALTGGIFGRSLCIKIVSKIKSYFVKELT